MLLVWYIGCALVYALLSALVFKSDQSGINPPIEYQHTEGMYFAKKARDPTTLV